ncbi:MAG: cupin domain-containing protein [Ginsengibacter sp.]
MAKVSDKKNSPHYVWGNNCDSWILSENASLSVKQETMPAGSKELLHFHSKCQQYFFILKGIATFYVDKEKLIVHQNQGIYIQQNSQHFIANETNEKIEFLVISQPAINNDRTNLE